MTEETQPSDVPATRSSSLLNCRTFDEEPSAVHEQRVTFTSDGETLGTRIVDTAVTMIVEEGDNFTMWDREIAAFNAIASPPKRLEILPAVSHMGLYSDQRDTNIAVTKAAAWFSTSLAKVDIGAS